MQHTTDEESTNKDQARRLIVENRNEDGSYDMEGIANDITELVAEAVQEGRLAELTYLLEDFGVEDNVDPIKNRIAQLGTDLHPTTAARINPCRNPEPHIVGSLPCCAGIIFRPEPVVEPVDDL